ncbi:MAG: energy transducer TonB [Zoogloeaceae bacterium]|nr:energy transducer TonB [Zoogloeaceae bacterium]
MTLSDRRLLFCFALSLLLHAVVLGSGALKNLHKPAPPISLQVSLRIPVIDEPPPEPLVKNTLEPEIEKHEPKPPVPKEPPPQAKPSSTPRPAQTEKRQITAAQQKLAEHLFYPQEAISRGLEGETRLVLVLGEGGSIADVQLAASSGHATLDNAAIKAAYAMGRLPGVSARQMILPVIFRLQ